MLTPLRTALIALALLAGALLAPPPAAAQAEFDLGNYPARDSDLTIPFSAELPQMPDTNTNKPYTIAPRDGPCYICRLIQSLATEAEAFTEVAARTLYPLFISVFNVVLILWLTWAGVRLMTGANFQLVEFGGRAVLAVVLFTALDHIEIWWHYVYLVTRDVLLALAMTIVGGISDAGIPPNAKLFSPFAQLYGMVENAILSVIVAGWAIITAPPTAAESTIPVIGGLISSLGAFGGRMINILFGAILMGPYVFVMLIFAAYVVEAIFKFLAVTALAPVWVVAAFLPRTRGFTEAAIRIYFSGGLTVVFAALAMGFTLAVTHSYTAELYNTLKEGEGLVIMGWGYWAMLVLGFISVLLHLKAATLASNISGANDGAGPAAATIVAGKLVVGMAAAGAARAAGLGGIGGALGRSGVGRAGGYGVGGLAAYGAGQAARGVGGGIRQMSPRMADIARRFAAGRGQKLD